MSSPLSVGSLTRTQPFFSALFTKDAAGARWLGRLLEATPLGPERLGELASAPGWLVTPLAVRAQSGRLACFEQPVSPPRDLLGWYIDHPDALSWVDDPTASPEATRLRRALICDEPAGARARAQERARELLRIRSALAPEWWRLESSSILDCVLITDRLVITIVGKRDEPLEPATPWYPPRSELVRDLEAARQVAVHRAWATILISDEPIPGGEPEGLAEALTVGAPHLDAEQRRAAEVAFLGNLTWARACEAVELPESVLVRD